jgi:hypothetical protein
LGDRPAYTAQSDGDLGRRLLAAFTAARDAGIGRAVMVGTDCPELQAAHLEQALQALGDHDLVLGPAADGGYYLIGARRPCPGLFRDMPWSTDRVLALTLARARDAGLRVRLLDLLRDLDTADDLAYHQDRGNLA